MKCTICDMCGAVIENDTQSREIVCSRQWVDCCSCSSAYSNNTSYQRANEIVWKHDVCISCADKILNSIKSNSEE